MKKLLVFVLCLSMVLSIALPVSALTTVPVKSLKLDKTSITLDYGKTYVLKTTFTPANTTQKLLQYATSDRNTVTVDAKGKITAVNPGKAVITVISASNSKVLAKCNVTVNQVVLTFEHQNTEKPERIAYFDKLAQKYAKLHPGIKIQITKSSFSTANNIILTAISSGKPFDMFQPVAGASDTKLWLEKNAILDLTPYYDANNGELKNMLREGVMEAVRYGDGKVYSLPFYLDTTPMNYHKEIFDKYKLAIPTTKDNFYQTCEFFKTNGFTPFQLHGSMMDDLLAAISLQFAALYKIKPYDIVAGKVPFTDAWFKESLKVMKEMYTKGYLPQNFWTIGGTEGRMAYSQGKMPMKFGFYWDVDTHKDMGMPYENQGVASLPNFTNQTGVKLYKLAGVGCFMVSSTCKNPSVAMDFLKFMINDENQDDLAYKYFGRYPNGMPVVNKNVELSEYAKAYIDDISSGIATPFSPTSVSLKYGETLTKDLPLFLQDKMTLDEIASDFDKLRGQ